MLLFELSNFKQVAASAKKKQVHDWGVRKLPKSWAQWEQVVCNSLHAAYFHRMARKLSSLASILFAA